MQHSPFTKRPWFYITVWMVILLVIYGWQIMRMGGVQASARAIAFDLLLVFPLLLVLWMAFFAQFILPVKTFKDRQKVFLRLLADLARRHGPALFIENGEVKEHSGERLKKGPGVIWLDTASAAVTRTPVAIKQVLGPGVYFTDKDETIAGTIDLHVQTQSVGPREDEDPFAEKKDDQDKKEYEEIQDRRKMVSALTRDGIEVVPTISVTFRVDTDFPKGDEPGSRFGYRTGVTDKARENEEKDKDAIRRAILGESVNLNVKPEEVRRRVAWNELPASLAVDVWREYAAKFTLDDLFEPRQDIPPEPPTRPEPADEEINPLSQPVLVTADQTNLQNIFTELLQKVNRVISRTIERLEGTPKVEPIPKQSSLGNRRETQARGAHQKATALHVINELVNARLKKQDVASVDEYGRRGIGTTDSGEYRFLKNRGITVLSVSISNPRFRKDIEQRILDKWSASWLRNAEMEKDQIERRHNIAKTAAQEKAIHQYANLLCDDLLRKRPEDIRESLKTLLMRTSKMITNNDQLGKRMSEGQQTLEDILRWVEAGE